MNGEHGGLIEQMYCGIEVHNFIIDIQADVAIQHLSLIYISN